MDKKICINKCCPVCKAEMIENEETIIHLICNHGLHFDCQNKNNFSECQICHKETDYIDLFELENNDFYNEIIKNIYNNYLK